MGYAVLKRLETKEYDISNYNITSHALGKLVVFGSDSSKSLVKSINEIKEALKTVTPVALRKKMIGGRKAFLDRNGMVYIVQDDTIITMYPNKKLFKRGGCIRYKKPRKRQKRRIA